jgi:hypothetical protein
MKSDITGSTSAQTSHQIAVDSLSTTTWSTEPDQEFAHERPSHDTDSEALDVNWSLNGRINKVVTISKAIK